MFSFYEFFAGAGMARSGLSKNWKCIFANDFDRKKAACYKKNWGDEALVVDDIRSLTSKELPGKADLVWASFPCQDLSLAGTGAGLQGDRSGTFWPFWALMTDLVKERRSPRLIVLENVCGTLTSHRGKDFATICAAFVGLGYNFGALVIDAARFVPQSRPRLFIVGAREDVLLPSRLLRKGPADVWHTRALCAAQASLGAPLREKWTWWNLQEPPPLKKGLSDLIEADPAGVKWHSDAETTRLLSLMSAVNLAKVAEARKLGRQVVGTVYKRTRRDEFGRKTQRAEVRFDNVSGCLRTPAGGSSRQVILVVSRDQIKSRLISPRETARLMGLPDSYELPTNYNEAYHLTGDGVAVPVVRHLAKCLFQPILTHNEEPAKAAA